MDFLERFKERISNTISESLRDTGFLKESAGMYHGAQLKSIAEKARHHGAEPLKPKKPGAGLR